MAQAKPRAFVEGAARGNLFGEDKSRRCSIDGRSLPGTASTKSHSRGLCTLADHHGIFEKHYPVAFMAAMITPAGSTMTWSSTSTNAGQMGIAVEGRISTVRRQLHGRMGICRDPLWYGAFKKRSGAIAISNRSWKRKKSPGKPEN